MASLANLENQQINSDFWHPFKIFFIWYNGEFGQCGKSTDQQRFFVPIQKIWRMASLENQQINRVLGIWYNGKYGQFRKSTDKQRFLVPIQKILRMASLANLANLENQQIKYSF